mmetsp:Transcript_35066/g.39786  ORF Transcript_35066/g.39786 Transcript_35066/m.39786 type:complete len:88 (+) Transcript_35066:1021-1284(+)
MHQGTRFQPARGPRIVLKERHTHTFVFRRVLENLFRKFNRVYVQVCINNPSKTGRGGRNREITENSVQSSHSREISASYKYLEKEDE